MMRFRTFSSCGSAVVKGPALILTAVLGFSVVAVADPITPEMQARVDGYKTMLSKWASDPAVVSAVKRANQNEAPQLDNQKWASLAETDPLVANYINSETSKTVTAWQQSELKLGKLYVRDQKGNLVAASGKPSVFNIADRPAFAKALAGNVWQQDELKPDPTNNAPSVQISVPVRDGTTVIGVMHAAVVGTGN